MMKECNGLSRRGVWSAICLSVLLGMSSVAYAQVETKLTASAAAAGDGFGRYPDSGRDTHAMA